MELMTWIDSLVLGRIELKAKNKKITFFFKEKWCEGKVWILTYQDWWHLTLLRHDLCQISGIVLLIWEQLPPVCSRMSVPWISTEEMVILQDHFASGLTWELFTFHTFLTWVGVFDFWRQITANYFYFIKKIIVNYITISEKVWCSAEDIFSPCAPLNLYIYDKVCKDLHNLNTWL